MAAGFPEKKKGREVQRKSGKKKKDKRTTVPFDQMSFTSVSNWVQASYFPSLSLKRDRAKDDD
jgi:hypothetical protein